MTRLSFIFPELPYSELNPNNLRRTHWSNRAGVEAMAREEARLLAIHSRVPRLELELVEVEYIFTLPDKHSRDLDNLAGACKPWLDGLVDAGILIKDDCWHVKKLTAGVRYQKGVQQTEIIINEVKEDEEAGD